MFLRRASSDTGSEGIQITATVRLSRDSQLASGACGLVVWSDSPRAQVEGALELVRREGHPLPSHDDCLRCDDSVGGVPAVLRLSSECPAVSREACGTLAASALLEDPWKKWLCLASGGGGELCGLLCACILPFGGLTVSLS